MTVTTRPIEARDRSRWEDLFAGYADFYGVPQTPQMRETVWGWLMDPEHGSNALVAEVDGAVVGFTHYRPFVSQLRAITNCFLDDLFVDPASRGSGAAAALIDGVRDKAVENGWGVVRWITAENNYRARALYDRVADKTPWVTYDIKTC